MNLRISPYLYDEYQRTKILRRQMIPFSAFCQEKAYFSYLAKTVLLQNYPMLERADIFEFTNFPETSISAMLGEGGSRRVCFAYTNACKDEQKHFFVPLVDEEEVIVMNGYYPVFQKLMADYFHQKEGLFTALITLAGKSGDPVFKEDKCSISMLERSLLDLFPEATGIQEYSFPEKEKVLFLGMGCIYPKRPVS